MSNEIAYRGILFYFKDTATLENLPLNKDIGSSESQYVYVEDGMLVVKEGKITKVGTYADLKKDIADLKVIDYSNKIILQGLSILINMLHKVLSLRLMVKNYWNGWMIMFFLQEIISLE